MAKTANTKDVAWLLFMHYSSPQQPVPVWTGFNQRTIKYTQDTTTMGYLPIINTPAYERDTESSVYGENTAHNNMMAKSYNRTTRAHKLTVNALWHLMWPNFQACAQARGIREDLQQLSEEVATSMDESGYLKWPSDPTELLKTLEDRVPMETEENK